MTKLLYPMPRLSELRRSVAIREGTNVPSVRHLDVGAILLRHLFEVIDDLDDAAVVGERVERRTRRLACLLFDLDRRLRRGRLEILRQDVASGLREEKERTRRTGDEREHQAGDQQPADEDLRPERVPRRLWLRL